MGSIVKMFTGGSSSKQSSGNSAFEQIKGLMSGNIGQGNSAMEMLGGMLGLGGGEKSAAAFSNYLDSSGYKALLDGGMDAITSGNAAKGLFQSGATGKAMMQYGQDLADTKLDKFMGRLTDLGSYGLDSAKTLAGAGQYSKGKSSSYNGIINSLFG
jgi:hypothetical protein